MPLKIKVLERKVIHEARTIRLVSEKVSVNGSGPIFRNTIEHPGAVVIVPIIDRKHVVMVRQYRHAVRGELLELPAGTLEPRESALSCARRELREETGWVAKRYRLLTRFYAAPGFTSEKMTVYLAQDLTETQASPEEDEMVRPVVLPLAEALRRAYRGTLRDGKSIIGLLLAERALRGA